MIGEAAGAGRLTSVVDRIEVGIAKTDGTITDISTAEIFAVGQIVLGTRAITEAASSERAAFAGIVYPVDRSYVALTRRIVPVV